MVQREEHNCGDERDDNGAAGRKAGCIMTRKSGGRSVQGVVESERYGGLRAVTAKKKKQWV